MPNVSRVSVVITVLNEISTIESTLNSLLNQSKSPLEIIVVDGGSNDGTWEWLCAFERKNRTESKNGLIAKPISSITRPVKPIIRTFSAPGNRSLGRNLAIKKSCSELIAITDAGCVPDPSWLEEMIKVKKTTRAEVVAGYYYGVAHSRLEEAIIPYALVMPHKLDADNFLPATRSMLMEKNVWRNLSGFDLALSDNEDYAFSKKIKAKGYNIAFAQKAKVGWRPRSNLKSFYGMIYRFARGDAQAGLWRPKVFLIFARYFFLTILLAISLFLPTIALFVVYLLWSIAKNYKYVKNGWFYLPLLQIISDFAVMLGTISGLRLLLKKNW